MQMLRVWNELTVNPDFNPETEINAWYKDLGLYQSS